MPILLDTHAWLWWVTSDRRLPKALRRRIDQAAARERLLLSLISVWEVAKRVEKAQLVLDRPLETWLDAATQHQSLRVVEITRPILVESCRLSQPFHGDPADQIIVATARDRDALLITKDAKIRDYPHVRSAW
jgi:PIN domain nuclease of toxin-antitoxin system